MNVLIWNTREAVKKDFGSILKFMVRKNSADIVVLLETRTQSKVCKKLMKKMGFDSLLVQEAQGFAGGNSFDFTAIYASPSQNVRNNLWEDLRKLSETMNRPWLLGGDFNEIAYTYEKIWGVPADPTKCANFSSVLEDCQEHQAFNSFIRAKWDSDFDFPYMLQRLVPELRIWNKKVFGDIDRKKNSITQKIANIQNNCTQNDSQALMNLESDYQRMLINVLREVELFWFQKSR
ncbi:uncharacterized protein LOC133318373 [Gastrolobium bilobum]|uniref:uncharacterized protein LOC133318373 n=1 Tax=Gastrolobium bilobum TaxID=150636 RepID=UPI002AAF7CD9|nr:uncharacterized protein LOC133318373 [Gastrolobium bilobum]